MQTERPLITVGMPVYNSGELVIQAIESVLNQDYENLELIISDDASTDNTLETCRSYAARDSRIKLLESLGNGGPLANFQRVLEKSQSEYFMWAAHDDYRDSNYLSVLLGVLLANPQVELCSARYVKVTPKGDTISSHPFPELAGASWAAKMAGQIAEVSAPWAYGLYRRAALRPVFERVRGVGVVWFWDYLLLWELILRQSITGTNATTIYQVKTGVSAPLFKPKSFGSTASFTLTVLLAMLQSLGRAPLSVPQKLGLLPSLQVYLERHLFNRRRWYSA